MFAGTIGRVTTALAAAHNENQVSLFNLNLDFTLFRVPTPPQFDGIGSIISSKRKENAESGPSHQTARKLGALFDGTLPEIPELIKAYGVRASEIAQSKQFRTTDQRAKEIFAEQLGADTTSIWAAVTSGEAAIAVHLLACMLARVFSGPIATSVWVEIVAERKIQIAEKQKAANFPSSHDAAMMASRQNFTREELAQWDNSARSWIQCGDLVMEKQHSEMLNMLDTAKLMVNREKNTFRSVMTAWKDALKAMNCLISGMPQRVQNGAILLGLSAWHLYPDLVLLSSARPPVRQKDPLISHLGVLTIGLEDSSLSDAPVVWSLPLAYMRYYGEPKLITGIAGRSNTRITMDLFAYIVLGSVVTPWVTSAFVPDPSSAIGILQKFSSFAKTTLTKPSNSTARNYPGFNENAQHFAKTSWIGQLLLAAESYEINDNETERSTAMKLIALGGRHKNFLCPASSHPAPLFGLTDFSQTLGLMKDAESRVAFFREYASSLGLAPDRYVIRNTTQADGRPVVVEYATTRPLEPGPIHIDSFLKEGSAVTGRNIRWLSIPTTSRDPCGCRNPCEANSASTWDRKRCKCSSTGCSLLCHDWRKTTPSKCGALCGYKQPSRLAELLSRGEQCLPVHQRDFTEDDYEKIQMCDFGTGSDFGASMKDLYVCKSSYLNHGREICSGL
ncbi:MAG: hypothetical protein L6R42_005605 [Xanthoria sp. 1 TBL-2021]|nr:MAG: hypothetical protein L6R42_005605 [Xanthoria sp. 1 TBL-2021]